MKRFWRFAKTTFLQFQADQCTHLAAAISYYAVFSLFPLLLGLIALASLFFEAPSVRAAIVEGVTSVLPASTDLVIRNIDQVVEERETLGLVSIVGFLWSAMAVFGAIRRAVNRAWDVERTRPFVRGKLLDLMLVISLGVLMALSIGLTWFFQTIATLQVPLLGLQPFGGNPLWNLVRALTPLAITVLVFMLLYKYVPNARVGWFPALLGAAVAAPLFELTKLLFVWYAENVANYSLVYGSVGAVIALLTGAYISAVILLLGAEIGAVYAKRSAAGTTGAAGDWKLGVRGWETVPQSPPPSYRDQPAPPRRPAQPPHAGWPFSRLLLLAATIVILASLLLGHIRPPRGREQE